MKCPIDSTAGDLLAQRTATTPDRTAIIDAATDTRWTYGAFDRVVDRVATELATMVGPVGVALGTGPTFVAVCFGAMRTGTVFVPLSLRETVAELSEKIDRTDVSTIVCSRDTEALATAVADECTRDNGRQIDVNQVRSTDSVDRTQGANEVERGAARSQPEEPTPFGAERADHDRDADDAPWPPTGWDDTLVIGFTSGSMGRPKAVQITVGNLLASATASAFRLGVGAADRWLCCLPMYHVGGLSPAIRSALYGTTVVIQREFDPETTIDCIEEYAITGVSLVPTMCARLLDAGWEPPASLRFVLLGGAPAGAPLLERCLERGVPVYPTYGTTETASQIATATPAQVRQYGNTVGQPLLSTQVSIVRDGQVVGPGESGELVVAGPTVTPGYLDDDRTTEAVGPHGLHTGDFGHRDADGRLYVEGRRDDRIVTGGENVDPAEVQAVLTDSPGVESAAVVGLPDGEWGERVGALVVPGQDGPEPGDQPRKPTATDLRDHCRDSLAGFKIPNTIAFTASLPRTASGTVDRGAVRSRLEREFEGESP